MAFDTTEKSLIRAMKIKTKASITVGITKTFNFLLFLNVSMKKLDVKEPNKNEKM